MQERRKNRTMAVPEPSEQRQENESRADVVEPEAVAAAGVDAFRTALEAGTVGMWWWDLASDRISWSTHFEDVHGRPEGARDGTCAFSAKDLVAQERPGVIAAIEEAFRTRKPTRLEFRIATEPGESERWLEASTTVILKNGAPVQLLGICRDITERLRVNREVRIRARQQEALGRLGERALTDSDLQKFFDDVASTVAEILDVELVKILELVPGDAELLLRAGVGWQPGRVGNSHESTGRASQAGYALAAGRPVIVDDLASETRFTGPQLLRDHGVVSGVSTPIAGHDGRAYGVLGAHSTKRRKFADYEVSFLVAVANVVAGAISRRQLDQRQELMIRELRHRSGNLFSQLLALFSQTAKNSRNVAELVTKYEARVLALAHAHRLITEGGWKSTSLNELLNTLLAPYLDRTSLQGPNVFLEPDPTFGLSMALHELVTNANKHGSLSVAGGRVDLTWSVSRTQQGLTLILDWKERNGVPPRRYRRPGFGTRLINMVIERQLNGQVQQTFGPEGLSVRLIVPLTHERWPGGVARSPSDLLE
jgi:PAS domain S-box-containing protein